MESTEVLRDMETFTTGGTEDTEDGTEDFLITGLYRISHFQ